MNFQDWLEHFQTNPIRHQEMEATVDWDAPITMDEATQRAFIRSFQRFELGENGDGKRLLAKAALAGDPTYLAALELLVKEEQKHSALFRRGLDHLHAPILQAHWSDAAFVSLRRMLGLRTELALFLIVETVAMDYFEALADQAPDPVLRGIGRRIANDERDHIRFQIDRLRQGFETAPGWHRRVLGAAWTVIAAGAATVVVLDHRAALRACGLEPVAYWRNAITSFRTAARSVLVTAEARRLGPTTKSRATHTAAPA
jgi:rubrerythrin